MRNSKIPGIALLLALMGAGLGCGSGETPGTTPTPIEPTDCEGERFDSTWEALYDRVIVRNDCANGVCHGQSAAGGLDLRPDVAYENLFQVPSTGSRWRRIEAGDKDRSSFWLKLAHKTLGPEYSVGGQPMPIGRPPVPENELEATRQWIMVGAPREGTVRGVEELLDVCLPEPAPLDIVPLEAPAPGEGVQFRMPPLTIAAASEQEVCFATVYDFSDQIPDWAFDPTGRYFRFSGQELRQSPNSHHAVLLYADFEPEEYVDHHSFGTWTCSGGPRQGEVCHPLDEDPCGRGGLCHSEIDPVSLGCIGYGPPGSGLGITSAQLGGAQEAQAFIEFPDGVFGQMPTRGIVYWSHHSFNLETVDAVLEARLNFPFARKQERPLQQIFNVERVFAPSAPPFTEQTVCHFHQLPRGARLTGLTSHYHEKGRTFWAELPDGREIYRNYTYNDPNKAFFDPPLEFDSEDPAERRIHFCATYNNGRNEDGTPNPDKVTRASEIPDSALQTFGACTPVACAEGLVGKACNGFGDDATCDSEPGAGDGFCDACAITGGESTKNEMFILIGQYHIEPGFPQPPAEGPIFAGLASLPDPDQR